MTRISELVLDLQTNHFDELYVRVFGFIEKYVFVRNKDGYVEKLEFRESQKFGDVGE